MEKLGRPGGWPPTPCGWRPGRPGPGVSPPGTGQAGGDLHPQAGRRAQLQGLPRLPRHPVHLGERPGGARHPRPLRAAGRRHHRHRLRRQAGRVPRRHLPVGGRGTRSARRPGSCSRPPSWPCSWASTTAAPASAWATWPPPCRPSARSGATASCREYIGHGIGRDLHEDPQVVYADVRPGTGFRMEAGMTITIEPIFNIGSHRCLVEPDGWTVRTADGSPQRPVRARRGHHQGRPLDPQHARPGIRTGGRPLTHPCRPPPS